MKINWGMWLRWSWRDLRARWVQVLAISLVIAFGTAVFTGMGGQKEWRLASADLSYEKLNMYDVHVELADNTYLDQAELEAQLSGIASISRLETRLVVDKQVDATQDADNKILVDGTLYGVPVADGAPHINSIYVDDESGRNLQATDSNTTSAIIEYKFARVYDLKPGDSIKIAGEDDAMLDFVGTGHFPEYFVIIPEGGGFFAEESFVAIFMPLDSLQNMVGRTGQVNDVVVQLESGADRDAVSALIKDTIAENFNNAGVTINYPEDDPVHKLLHEDPENDQAIWDMMAIFFLLGAALATFNLAGRMVQSQRREIGIGMALGVPRQWLALRPLLVGLQIALLGTAIGVVLGTIMSNLMADLVLEFSPLPYTQIDVNWGNFITGTAIGILMPVVATLIPTWRAIRVPPIDAIRSGHLIAKGGGWSKLLAYLPIPGKSFTQMPFRNLLRSPGRMILTVIGIGVAISMQVLFIGVLDSFRATMDKTAVAYEYQSAERFVVNLDDFYAENDPIVQDINTLSSEDGTALFSQTQAQIVLGGQFKDGDGTAIDTMLTLQAMDSEIWVPDLIDGKLPTGANEIVISEKMANDLDIWAGDMANLEHPVLEIPTSPTALPVFRNETTAFKVVGIHNNPLRMLSYMNSTSRTEFGLPAVANQLVGVPTADVSQNTVRSTLFNQVGVGSVESISDYGDAFDEALELFVDALNIIQVIVLFLAFLIAFNTTSISVDERSREIATMFAFGLPIRTVTRMQILENVILGILGTLVGLGLGWITLTQSMGVRIEEQLADMNFIITITPQSLALAVILGVLVVGLTPLLNIRKMLKMNIPNELRIME